MNSSFRYVIDAKDGPIELFYINIFREIYFYVLIS